MSTRTPLRAAGVTGAALVLGAGLALGVPLSASAHVTLDENTAEAGSYALLTFKVPDESDTAATNSVTLNLPTDTPFLSVRTVPVPGWEAELVREQLPEPVQVGGNEITEAVTTVVWTATDGGIGDGELVLFPISLGPVPDVGSVVFTVDQGYDDGSVVPWEGADAPTLYVNDAPPSGGHHHGDDDSPEHADEADAGEEPATAGEDAPELLGPVLGGIGILLGGVALVVALTRGRRSA